MLRTLISAVDNGFRKNHGAVLRLDASSAVITCRCFKEGLKGVSGK